MAVLEGRSQPAIGRAGHRHRHRLRGAGLARAVGTLAPAVYAGKHTALGHLVGRGGRRLRAGRDGRLAGGARVPLILIGGGVRSGKSAFALRYARRLGERRVFVATAQALDDEMRGAHRAPPRGARAGDFVTVEEPLDAGGALARASRPATWWWSTA